MAAERVFIIYRDTDEETHKIVKRYKKKLSEICPAFGCDSQRQVPNRMRLLMASTWVIVMWDRATEDGAYCFELYTAIYFATLNKLTNIIYLLPDGTPVPLKDDLPWCFKQLVMNENWIENLKVQLRPDPPKLDDSGPTGIAGALKKLVPSGDANLTSPGGITRHLRNLLTSIHVRNDYYAILTEFVKGSTPKPSVEEQDIPRDETVETASPEGEQSSHVEEQTTANNELIKATVEDVDQRQATETIPQPETPDDTLATSVTEEHPRDIDAKDGKTGVEAVPITNVVSPGTEERVTIPKEYIDEIKRMQLVRLRHLTYVIVIIHAAWYACVCAYIFVSFFREGLIPHFTAFLLLLDVAHSSWNIVYYRMCRLSFVCSSYILLLLLGVYACFLYAFLLYLAIVGTLSTESLSIATSINLVSWIFIGANLTFGKCNQIIVTLYLTCNHYALLSVHEAMQF